MVNGTLISSESRWMAGTLLKTLPVVLRRAFNMPGKK
jgi:hypothetical protein